MDGRVSIFESNDKIYIQIEDSDADIACSVSMTYEDFGKVLPSSMSQGCEIHYIKPVFHVGGNDDS